MIKYILSTFTLLFLIGCGANEGTNQGVSGNYVDQELGSNELNIYSSRHYDIDFDLIQTFEQRTGITVNMLQGNGHEILERALREQHNPQADLFINVGSITMYTALSEGLLQPLNSSQVASTVREGMFGDYWTALATRARVIVYDNLLGDYVSISRYSDLADPLFYNSILVRSSTNLYNVALVAALLQVEGEDEAIRFIEGIVNNMARVPQGNDRDQMRAIVAGEGRFGITNNYYIQMMFNSPDETDIMVGERMDWIFPDEVFEDISWGGIINGAANRENAVKFLEFLLEEEQQNIIMNINGEAPANLNVQISDDLAKQNDFTSMPVNFETLGMYTTRAAILMDIAGWQ